MDDRGFDRLARAVAGTLSRRGAMRAAVAGAAALAAAARGEPVFARPYSIPLGGACYHTRQCIPGDPFSPYNDEVSCADNLIPWDGELNCCRWRGGECDDDSQCCGQNYCIGFFCQPIG